MRVKLTISYDGTDFCGWQIQPSNRTVQQVIEESIYELTKEKVKLVGSGRTDAGVHAIGQTAHFDIESESIPAEKFYKALNVILPKDVKILKSERVEKTFDATRNAKKKTYRYSVYISDAEKPLLERFAVLENHPLDLQKIKETAKEIEGEHDFKGFSATGGSVKTTVRTIYKIDVLEENGLINFYVTGSGFLYKMVRLIVGALIKVGEGVLTKEDIINTLKTGKRNNNFPALAPKGLTLFNVEYV